MSLQLILGGSGSGKSQYLYNDIIKRSQEHPKQNYIIVVPEQYTMETQKKIVNMHPRRGILNIDVVSFERFAFKVFEEVGGQNRPVLDETGKNLIIRRVLESCKKNMTYFGSSINKVGFVSELKSVISEMLQYNIGPDRLKEICEQSKQNRQLSAKLNDISLVYSAFKDYMSSNYITSEEILDVLCNVLNKSDMVKNSEIVFDGFTGFTPVQYKLIRLLLNQCRSIQISITIDRSEKVNVYEGMQNLFFMSKEFIQKLMKICDEKHVEVKNNIYLGNDVNYRFIKDNKPVSDLAYLEKNIFRFGRERYMDVPENIKIYNAFVPKDEAQFVVSEIIKLTRLGGYRYKDIAIVLGDMDSYAKITAKLLELNDIPYFLDNKRKVTGSSFVELIRSSLEIIEKGYTYDSILRYLKTGMTGIDKNDIDVLDNYCIAMGIRGKKAWHDKWKKQAIRGKNKYDLERLNELRQKIVDDLSYLQDCVDNSKKGAVKVKDMMMALYRFITALNCSQAINEMGSRKEAGKEYDQLYKKVMQLFDKIVELLGEEILSIGEFNKIIDAGFDEIKVGLIPPTNDCVVIGDIERTRLDNVRVMFFMGVNDGIVPKTSENRSVLSQTDRNYLENMNIEMAPSSRKKAFIQRFYLYLIMTKASEKLYISYSGKDTAGNTILPSYLIRNIRNSFPEIQVSRSENIKPQLGYIKIPKAQIEWNEENYINTLSANTVLDLYGNEISGSVTSFEKFASCQFAYFLQYGLKLTERDEYKFAVNDFGTILHAVLEDVTGRLIDSKKSISLLSDDERSRMVTESVIKITNDYGNTILKDSSRNEYMIDRIIKLADRTVLTVGKQLEKGMFTPDAYEIKFLVDSDRVKGDKRLSMVGKIDRIDICEDDENVYVNVIDYKTGKTDFELLKTYYGLKLQLITYMKAAMNIEKIRHPAKRIIPSGILYYNIENPIIEADSISGDDSENKDCIELKLLEALRMKGVINDNISIIKKMDDTDGKSLCYPVSFKKDGSISGSGSHVMSTEMFELLNEYISKKTADMSEKIFAGQIRVNPYDFGNNTSCTYCPFSAVCGFSPDLNSLDYRHIKKLKSTDIWENIRNGVDENGKSLDE